MEHKEIAQQIIKAVGGQENINNAWHCMTRLRFNLKDEKQVDYKALDKIPKVVGTKYQSEQLQVVIGTDVADYFKPLAKELGLDGGTQAEAPKEKKGLVSLFMDTVSGVFGPLVPAIAGAGMIKGLMAGLVALNVISNQTDTYLVIDMLASGVFTFLPFFVAASAAKIFQTNQYLAIAIAAALQFPTMSNAVAEGKVSQFLLFGAVPVPVFNYAGTVIPIILAVLALSYIYRWVDKVLPQVLRTVFTPTISLFVAGLVTLTIIGPISIHLGNLLAAGVEGLFSISPILAGIVVGAIRPIAIFTGLHHAMTPIALQNFANQGYDMLMPMMFMANMAITGATAAMYTKVKTKEEKSVILSSAISGLLGITEPALFGILSKYKKAFLAATIGSGVASAFISFFGVRIYGYILSSIFSLPAYIGQYFVFAILGIVIAIGLSFIIAYIMVPKEEGEDGELTNELSLHAVAKGQYVPLNDVADEVFSTKMMGDGFAIEPSEGTIFSPVSGTVTTVFPSKHAIGLRTNSGVEVLVHMGIDTVSLNGEGFTVFVKEGDTVNTNTKLATMDLAFIKAQEKATTVIVVVTNMERVRSFAGEKIIDGRHQPGDVMERLVLN
ncbi:PTS beta-glucoside transporter subunit EIIBCA [Enterococcus sp. JM4C]|uniref:glucose PTS transporter subunit IIA n=1 Tax=Candidatus Enterococcus huntleyi TaxID=1857217 RepID=UPI00137A2E89|nr:glucose PTS transporter subunit IIA [Enterococcus sp. JM4C]KAF1298058.1 PTS beta-glucoside transporter subunit EIIBCA [Enterococcus sp. JM4C]